MDTIGKPYVILLNASRLRRPSPLRARLEEKYCAPVLAVNAEELTADQISTILERVFYEFPVLSIDIDLPDWMRVLDVDSPAISKTLQEIRQIAPKISKMSDCALLDGLFSDHDRLRRPTAIQLDPAAGCATVKVEAKEGAFYQTLGEQCGIEIGDDFALMSYVATLTKAKKLYDRVGQAFHDAQEYGYGIVPPEGMK